MRSGRQRSWRQGFTLVEMLAVTAIVVILLAVSAVGVVYYARWLKIAELDNAAREIYLAAENRAVLLSGSGRLKKLVTDPSRGMAVTLESGPEGEQTDPNYYYIYHSTGSEVADADLLPPGSIDSALMEGCFYIVYDPVGGSVTDVFYAEEDPKENGIEFQDFYGTVSTLSRSARMQMTPMVGYYGGGTADNANDGTLGVPAVTIKNDETLTAEITYSVLASMKDKTELTVKLTCGGSTVDISPGDLSPTVSYGRAWFSCTIPLDSLEAGKHFSDLFSAEINGPASFGGNFTVTATLSAEGVSINSTPVGSNSLFAEGSGGDTAYIANLRHLQNLNENTSKVGGKTEAVQTANINCAAYLGEDYTFTPIQNSGLTSYDGNEFVLRGLHAEGTDAGLFASVPSGAALKNIRMVNAKAESTRGNAGALAGVATDATFDNCWVYWEPEAGSAGLRGVLGDNESGYKYQVTGANAGGLVGQLTGGSIEDCLAATLVNGTDTAGGLVGQAAGNVSITASYADCYLSGKSVGGLAGTAGSLTLQNCFSAGFIDIPETGDGTDGESGTPVPAAGLCAGGTVTATSVYSVMRCSGTNVDWTPLAPNMTDETSSNYYYLSSAIGGEADEHAKTYTQMTGSDFATTLNNGANTFGRKLSSDSHPYNLRTDLALTVYDFPGLAELPHYGDWSAQFTETSLVYFEQYGENAYGFYGGGVDLLQNKKPIKDGYAIAIRQEGDAQGGLTVTINGTDYTYNAGNLYTVTDEDGTYLLAPLPEELVNTTAAEAGFYQPLTFSIGDEVETHDYCYCPHFPKTAVKTDAETSELPPAPTGVSVRTPRHLYMLSLYPEYYNRSYNFYQELDLDYAVYTGYADKLGLSKPGFTQEPIGHIGEPFNGLYDGGCHAIENLAFELTADQAYAGLFGYSSGTLRDIVYLKDSDSQMKVSLSNDSNLYIGGLVGGNAGSILNCAASGVVVTGNAFKSATVYIGGLVGLNQGTITNCEAECAALTADASSYAHACVGGLVGQNQSGGIISASYAVGRATAVVDSNSDARVCGFAGENQGLIRNCYAAMDLESSGTAVDTYGFCSGTEGEQSGTFFLNIGNFTYRNASYNASYTPRPGEAEQIRYDALTDRTAGSPVAGMSFEAGDDKSPYPTGVTNAAGEPAHYGSWPEPADLGIMGVYYWEELVIPGQDPSYHVSLLAVDLDEKTIAKQTTLSNAHADNGVVTDYGYGYYYSEEATGVTLTAEDLSYATVADGTVGSEFTAANADNEDETVNGKLAELMPGYTFHSYHSYRSGEQGGLYPTAKFREGLDPDNNIRRYFYRKPNGTFTLNQNGLSVKFTLNPHFADALSVAKKPNNTWTLNGGASTVVPGKNGNPFQVRALSQLQNINWCMRPDSGGDGNKEQEEATKLSNSIVIYNSSPDASGIGSKTLAKYYDRGNQYGFLYLSHVSTYYRESDDYSGRVLERYEYSWVQTHDIDGKGSSFTPIAAFKDVVTIEGADGSSDKNTLYKNATVPAGWFGGGSSYDGQSYTIKNINIAADDANCVGLFGVTIDATIKNIVLYSEKGDNTVTVKGRSSYNQYYSWYAAGGLVGVAAVSTADGADRTISNCSVAGYTIVDETEYSNALVNGGGAVGGLVGVCNLDLANCTATTTIKMPTTRSSSDGENASPVRAGGLAGTCVASITNCYAGGEIKWGAANDDNLSKGNFYVSGLVGGAGMRHMIIPTRAISVKTGTVTIRDSYSTVTLPSKAAANSGNGTIRGKYAIGGQGGANTISGTGTNQTGYNVTISNCYTLYGGGSDTTGVTKVTYAQLANENFWKDKLTSFSPVTSEIDGFSVAGKYSYPSTANLQGLNYPFPTILTREGQYHVHYGNWPLSGIDRDDGGKPIELDLFTNPIHTEELGLEGVASGGTWSVGENGALTVTNEIFTAGIDQDGTLTVTGNAEGTTTLTVTYTKDDVAYTMDLSVNVTAVLELRTPNSPVKLFTNDTVDVELTPYGKGSKALDLDALRLTVTAKVEKYESEWLEKAEMDGLTLNLVTGSKASGSEDEDTTVSINYTFTYKGVDYNRISATNFHVVEPEIEVSVGTNEDGTKRFIVFGEGTIADAVCEDLGEGGNKLTFENGTATLDMTDVAPGTTITVDVSLTIEVPLTKDSTDSRTHTVKVSVPVEKPEITEGEGEEEGKRLIVFTKGTITGAEVTSGSLGEDKEPEVNQEAGTVTLDMADVAPGESVIVEVTLNVDGQVHTVNVKVAKPPAETGGEGSEETETNENQAEVTDWEVAGEQAR